MKYIALICARGGSKGLPGKNIKQLNGIPLIGWSIKIAKQIDRISRVIVSTDSEEIAKIALEYGAEVPFIRPENLALDNSPEWSVWRHSINYLENHQSDKIDALVVLPVTAPLRTIRDVNKCIDLFEKGGTDSVITVSESNRNPYFNMTSNEPQVFDMTTVAYVVDANFVKEFNGIFEGKVKSVTIPAERAIDIDTMLDFKVAECLLLN
jgi:CMP-N-acetylneuraminic acid synthetase